MKSFDENSSNKNNKVGIEFYSVPVAATDTEGSNGKDRSELPGLSVLPEWLPTQALSYLPNYFPSGLELQPAENWSSLSVVSVEAIMIGVLYLPLVFCDSF